MKGSKALIIFLILPFFVFACSSTKVVRKLPRLRVVKTTLAKGIDDTGTAGVPLNPATTFSTRDAEVISHIKYENLSGKHRLRWEWFDPDGNLYCATKNHPIQTSKNKYVKEGSSCHRISIRGAKAQDYPGEWTVKIYLDDVITASDSFEIKEPRIARETPPLKPPGMIIPDIDFGDYYALVIGNNNYQYLPKLMTAKNDAEVVGHMLRHDYGFNVDVLMDATRSDILLALNRMRKNLTERDNLLIYYAGHGWLDEEADAGYWLPVDAASDNKVNWVSNYSVTAALKAMAAKHVLIVADSCYAGKMTRGIHIQIRTRSYLSTISKKRARCVLCSGGLEPVVDSGGKRGHSVFASAFIEALQDNQGVIDCTELFSKIRRPVMLNADQTPEYSDIRKAGHQGGDFLFVRQQE